MVRLVVSHYRAGSSVGARFSESACPIRKHVEAGNGGVVDLDDLTTWRMSGSATVGDLVMRVNALNGVQRSTAVRVGG